MSLKEIKSLGPNQTLCCKTKIQTEILHRLQHVPCCIPTKLLISNKVMLMIIEEASSLTKNT